MLENLVGAFPSFYGFFNIFYSVAVRSKFLATLFDFSSEVEQFIRSKPLPQGLSYYRNGFFARYAPFLRQCQSLGSKGQRFLIHLPLAS
jgi:hypothetical protein